MKKYGSTSKWQCDLNTDVCDSHTNADLTITLKMGFRQINPAGGAAEGTYNDYGNPAKPARKIIKWTEGAWSYWKREFVSSAQKYWHGKFWLINNFDDLTYDVKGKKFRSNIYCRFVLKEVGTLAPGATGPEEAHHIIDVVRLHSSENWFGSHWKLYDSRDMNLTQKATDSTGKKVMQRAHVHEVGHLLGMGHVDEGKPHCPKTGDTNAGPCYGIADADMKNVMGSGMALTTANAQPWREAVILLTGKGTLGVATDWVAKLLPRQYPRTHEEAVAGKLITSWLPR